MSRPEILFRGLAKVIEEAGELTCVTGKLLAYPEGEHPDGKGDLVKRLEEEIADLYAAMDYLVTYNKLDYYKIEERRKQKFDLFRSWKMAGIKK